MIREVNEFERNVKQIREGNKTVLAGFKNHLEEAGLSGKTFQKHFDNVDFYLNEFLLYESPITPSKGVHEVGSFLGYWYIRKCGWATEHDMRKNATSLKKFYTYLCGMNEVSEEDLQALKQQIREELSDWVATLLKYTDPSLTLEQVWGFDAITGEENAGDFLSDEEEFLLPAGPSGQGTCFICETHNLKRASATNHLKRCLKKNVVEGQEATDQVLLKIEGCYSPDYWLYVLIPIRSPLSMLDRFLRDIWLECCGHLSAFTIGGQRYESRPDEEFGNSLSMDVPLAKVLKNTVSFKHEYDYGSTTMLRLQVIDQRKFPRIPDDVLLLAQNNPIAKACSICGKPAEWIWPLGWGKEACYCTACGEKSEDPEMLLPLVNSPRTGVCGYTG